MFALQPASQWRCTAAAVLLLRAAAAVLLLLCCCAAVLLSIVGKHFHRAMCPRFSSKPPSNTHSTCVQHVQVCAHCGLAGVPCGRGPGLGAPGAPGQQRRRVGRHAAAPGRRGGGAGLCGARRGWVGGRGRAGAAAAAGCMLCDCVQHLHVCSTPHSSFKHFKCPFKHSVLPTPPCPALAQPLSPAAVGMVSELDPDAPSRQSRQLHPDDAKDEERLLARVFRLLRAGGCCSVLCCAVLCCAVLCLLSKPCCACCVWLGSAHLAQTHSTCVSASVAMHGHGGESADWQLPRMGLCRVLRVGRVSEARQLCEAVGQPWRAASLGGGGAAGPLPLGAAAEEADVAEPGLEQAQDLATEVSGAAASSSCSRCFSCALSAHHFFCCYCCRCQLCD